MIKILKIQKGIFLIVLGVIAIITYAIMVVKRSDNSEYVLGFAGALFILGSLMLLYPILTAKKDKDGIVQLDKEKAARAEKDEEEKAQEKSDTAAEPVAKKANVKKSPLTAKNYAAKGDPEKPAPKPRTKSKKSA